jgi:hypothetical protein
METREGFLKNPSELLAERNDKYRAILYGMASACMLKISLLLPTYSAYLDKSFKSELS